MSRTLHFLENGLTDGGRLSALRAGRSLPPERPGPGHSVPQPQTAVRRVRCSVPRAPREAAQTIN
jgi:hypothetical protein